MLLEAGRSTRGFGGVERAHALAWTLWVASREASEFLLADQVWEVTRVPQKAAFRATSPDAHPASSRSSSSPSPGDLPEPSQLTLVGSPHLHKPPLSLPCPRPLASRMPPPVQLHHIRTL